MNLNSEKKIAKGFFVFSVKDENDMESVGDFLIQT